MPQKKSNSSNGQIKAKKDWGYKEGMAKNLVKFQVRSGKYFVKQNLFCYIISNTISKSTHLSGNSRDETPGRNMSLLGAIRIGNQLGGYPKLKEFLSLQSTAKSLPGLGEHAGIDRNLPACYLCLTPSLLFVTDAVKISCKVTLFTRQLARASANSPFV